MRGRKQLMPDSTLILSSECKCYLTRVSVSIAVMRLQIQYKYFIVLPLHVASQIIIDVLEKCLAPRNVSTEVS